MERVVEPRHSACSFIINRSLTPGENTGNLSVAVNRPHIRGARGFKLRLIAVQAPGNTQEVQAIVVCSNDLTALCAGHKSWFNGGETRGVMGVQTVSPNPPVGYNWITSDILPATNDFRFADDEFSISSFDLSLFTQSGDAIIGPLDLTVVLDFDVSLQ